MTPFLIDTCGPAEVVTRALVVNASHEPLSIVTCRRALVLVLAGKAECVAEQQRTVFRSPTCSLVVPSVVRLLRYVAVPRPAPSAVTRAGVLARDGRRCAYCDAAGETIDHVVPRSRGGQHTWENCVACCLPCNRRKGSRLVSELGWSMRVAPAPPRTGRGRVHPGTGHDPAWAPWLAHAA